MREAASEVKEIVDRLKIKETNGIKTNQSLMKARRVQLLEKADSFVLRDGL